MPCTFSTRSLTIIRVVSPTSSSSLDKVTHPNLYLLFSIDVVYLRGLYFKKIYDKNDKFGLLLYSEGDRFKARRMYHRDESVLETWMRYLSKHCGFYSPAEIYEQISRIGGGKFADVYDSRHRITGKVCAVKKINKVKLNQKEKQFLRNELLIISMISHPNVVAMYEYFETSQWIYIAMECVRGGELFHYLDQVDLSEY